MYYKLLISGEMENVAGLEPTGGLDDPSFAFHFKLKGENCGESSAKETCVSLDVKLPLPSNNNFYVNLVQKCKCCDRMGTIRLIPLLIHLRPLTTADCEAGKYIALMGFDCSGLVPHDYSFIGSQWRVESRSGMVFENIDLVSGEWAEYDELLMMPVTISHLKSKFVPLDRKTLDRIYSGFRVRPEAIHGA